jgi:hypothetical protein
MPCCMWPMQNIPIFSSPTEDLRQQKAPLKGGISYALQAIAASGGGDGDTCMETIFVCRWAPPGTQNKRVSQDHLRVLLQ